jgi:hypothetical protein
MTERELLLAMPVGYLVTILVETPVLLLGLSARHSVGRRLFAGAWLTACTYPVVWLVLPPLLGTGWVYITVAETFAPVAECLLFLAAFGTGGRGATVRDLVTITAANLLSFGVGELLFYLGADAWLRDLLS